MNNFNQIIQFAIDREIEAETFYLAVAAKTTQEGPTQCRTPGADRRSGRRGAWIRRLEDPDQQLRHHAG